MNSMERVLTTLSFKEPDRVPMMLLLSSFGAKESAVSIDDYFSDDDMLIEQQLKMKKKYQNDCYLVFKYAALEIEIIGGEVIYNKETPPNSGTPVIDSIRDINKLNFPEDFFACKETKGILNITKSIHRYSKGDAPIIGVVVSPFSLPVMQMGFEAYINLIYNDRDHFWKLMDKNMDFCKRWANAQLDAGATAICYFDPLASPSMIHHELYMNTGYRVAKDVIEGIKGPVVTHLASGILGENLKPILDTKSVGIGISAQESIKSLKDRTYGKVSLLGNLNGLEMIQWNKEMMKDKVGELIDILAPGGGFILSDNHGEIPYQVSSDLLLELAEYVSAYGRY